MSRRKRDPYEQILYERAERRAQRDAIYWLAGFLVDNGPQPSPLVLAESLLAEHKLRYVYRAKDALRLVTTEESDGRCHWALPDGVAGSLDALLSEGE